MYTVFLTVKTERFCFYLPRSRKTLTILQFFALEFASFLCKHWEVTEHLSNKQLLKTELLT